MTAKQKNLYSEMKLHPAGLPTKFVRSPNFWSTYTNNAQLKASNWDFVFTFGEATVEGESQTVEQRVGITMSPQHAKALLGTLNETVANYEKVFGEIRWQPNVKALDKNGQT